MNLFKNLFGKKKKEELQQPEDLFVVEITDVYIKVTHPGRADEMINWDEIEEIKIANTDAGPLLPDVWMILVGNGKGCSIPHGSKGWEDVFQIVCKYPGFKFENVIESAICTDNKLFDIWKR